MLGLEHLRPRESAFVPDGVLDGPSRHSVLSSRQMFGIDFVQDSP